MKNLLKKIGNAISVILNPSLGRVGGIAVNIDASVTVFFLVALALQSWYLMVSMAVAYSSILLHEFGHAFVAKYYGLNVPSITIFFFGGMARIEKLPHDEPKKEFWITVMGPAVNLALALIYFTLAILLPPLYIRSGVDFWLHAAALNVFIFTFNLLPAYPMDGGRLFRSLMGIILKIDFVKASQIAVRVGQVCAALLFVYGIYAFEPMLFFIAPLMAMGAQAELQQVYKYKDQKTLGLLLYMIAANEPQEKINQAIGQLRDQKLKTYVNGFFAVLSQAEYRQELLQAIQSAEVDKVLAVIDKIHEIQKESMQTQAA